MLCRKHHQQLAQGASGGLVILWNPKSVIIQSHKNENSWQLVEVEKFNLHFWLINVCGPTSTLDKKNLWDEITSQIGLIHTKKIVLTWDFNAITSLQEKSRGISLPPKVMSDFNQFIASNALRDIQPLTGKFT